MNLFIIGNGFDISHGLSTEYKKFKTYLFNEGRFPKYEVAGLSLYNCLSDFYNIDDDVFWKYFEKSLGEVNEENLMALVKAYKEQFTDIFRKIVAKMGDAFAEWVLYEEKQKNLSSLNRKPFYNDLFGEDDYYLSFNYTKTLESIYSINVGRIKYIHGQAMMHYLHNLFALKNDSNIIFGHAENVSTNKGMKEFLKITEKPVSKICETYFDFLKDKSIENIYVFGHSYGEVDLPYFFKIADICPKAIWHLYWFSKEDLMCANNFLSNLRTMRNNADIGEIRKLKDM